MEIFLTWLFLTLPSIKGAFTAGAVLIAVFVALGMLWDIVGEYELTPPKLKWIIAFGVFCSLAVLLPSKEVSYAMAGVYVAKEISETEIAKDAVQLIHKEIKKGLEE